MDDLKIRLNYFVAYNHLIPALAHLCACVEILQALQSNHHHDITKENVRQILPILNGGQRGYHCGHNLAGGEQDIPKSILSVVDFNPMKAQQHIHSTVLQMHVETTFSSISMEQLPIGSISIMLRFLRGLLQVN